MLMALGSVVYLINRGPSVPPECILPEEICGKEVDYSI